MRTFEQQPHATQPAPSAKSSIPGRGQSGLSREVSAIRHLQRTIGNQAVQRLLKTNPDRLEDSPNTTSTASHKIVPGLWHSSTTTVDPPEWFGGLIKVGDKRQNTLAQRLHRW